MIPAFVTPVKHCCVAFRSSAMLLFSFDNGGWLSTVFSRKALKVKSSGRNNLSKAFDNHAVAFFLALLNESKCCTWLYSRRCASQRLIPSILCRVHNYLTISTCNGAEYEVSIAKSGSKFVITEANFNSNFSLQPLPLQPIKHLV